MPDALHWLPRTHTLLPTPCSPSGSAGHDHDRRTGPPRTTRAGRAHQNTPGEPASARAPRLRAHARAGDAPGADAPARAPLHAGADLLRLGLERARADALPARLAVPRRRDRAGPVVEPRCRSAA